MEIDFDKVLHFDNMASVDVGLSSDASGQWQHNKEITRLCNMIWNVIIYGGKLILPLCLGLVMSPIVTVIIFCN